MHWIKSFRLRKALNEIVTIGTAVACALILWKMWICVTGCKSPFAIVVSGSMEPGIRRGDILFLHNSRDPIRTGEIVVFNTNNALDIPIVHRVIQVHERRDTGEIDILTKGDANRYDDRIFYAPGQLWLQQHRIIGRVMGFIPYVGWPIMLMLEKPLINYILIGALGLLKFVYKN